METLGIGEVTRRAGVRTSAIRYYEEAGVLPAPHRAGGRRRYGPEAIRVLGVLRFAQQAGFTLGEIRTLFHGFGADTPLSERWQALARAKLRELDQRIANAERMKEVIRAGLACECVRAEDCLLGPGDDTGPATPAVG